MHFDITFPHRAEVASHILNDFACFHPLGLVNYKLLWLLTANVPEIWTPPWSGEGCFWMEHFYVGSAVEGKSSRCYRTAKRPCTVGQRPFHHLSHRKRQKQRELPSGHSVNMGRGNVSMTFKWSLKVWFTVTFKASSLTQMSILSKATYNQYIVSRMPRHSNDPLEVSFTVTSQASSFKQMSLLTKATSKWV